MVVFFMYRLPDGQEAFHNDLQGFQEDAAQSVRLPERRLFDATVLPVLGASDQWNHQCFACSSRNLFHVYSSNNEAVFVRLFSQKGTMLDHPLLKLVCDNVSLVPGQWETESPGIVQIAKVDSASVSECNDGVTLDLTAEYTAIIELLQARVAEFDPETNYGPGEGAIVSSIDLGFDFAQGGWVAVVFDTRPKRTPDGNWTTFLAEDRMLARPQWPLCAEALAEGHDIVVIMRDRTVRKLSKDSADLGEILGLTLRDALLNAKIGGIFDRLPKSSKCSLGVEDVLGSFSWTATNDQESNGSL